MGFLCKPRPSTTSSFVGDYGEYVAAQTRLLTVEKLSVDALQVALRQRVVQFEARESKDSLVRKIMVTDPKVDKKSSEVLHLGPGPLSAHADVRVTSQSAILAVLRNRLCKHGIDERKHQSASEHRARRRVIDDSIERILLSMPRSSSIVLEKLFASRLKNWLGQREVLQADFAKKTIPRMMWKTFVQKYVKNECDHLSNFLFLSHSMIISEIMDILIQEPDLQEADILRELHRRLYFTVSKISQGQKGLIIFMHSPDRRVCDCLAFVATAADVGVYRTTKEIQREAKQCATCGEALANPKKCSRCHKVAYCNAQHQKQHWKEHKKSCKAKHT